MRVTVTGGAGFIGSAVVRRALAHGHKVTVLDDFSTGHEENLAGLEGVRLVRGDVGNPVVLDDALSGSSGVFHLAAQVGNLRSLADPLRDALVNVQGTLQVLEGMRRHHIERLVFSSSAAVYGEAKTTPVAEDHPNQPDSPYGASKLAAEKYCLCYGRVYGWRVACLRYFNVFGVRQRFDAYGNVVPIFLRRLLRGEEVTVYGDGEQTRDFVDVDDVAVANVSAMAAGVTGAFNVATGVATTINVLVNTLANISERNARIRHVQARPGEVRHSRASVSLAEAEFHYAPEVPLEVGLRRQVEWFRREELDG